MKTYQLYPGEGISGSLGTVGATTTGLTTCMGILMINEKSKLGGLYHYPGSGLSQVSETRRNQIKDTIMSMITAIKPETIYVTPADDGTSMGMPMVGEGSTPEDIVQVKSFLQTLHKGTLTMRTAAAGANYHFDASGLQFTVSGMSSRDGLKDKQDEFDKNGRDVGNGATYYGKKMG